MLSANDLFGRYLIFNILKSMNLCNLLIVTMVMFFRPGQKASGELPFLHVEQLLQAH